MIYFLKPRISRILTNLVSHFFLVKQITRTKMLAFFKLEKNENQISNSFNSSNSWLELSWRKEKDSVQVSIFWH